MEKTKILITGAAGFIGSHLVACLVERNYEVVVVDRLLWGEDRIKHLFKMGVRLEQGDTRDEELMARVAAQGPFDIVYHLAALHYIPYCSAHPVETLSVNVVGTQVLLEALKEAFPRRVVFVSSGDVYAPKTGPHDESDPLEPFSIYGLSKLFGERLITLASKQMLETSFVVARLFNAYGPRETNPHLIPSIINQLRQGNRVRLGNTWPKRDYVYVQDIAEVLAVLGILDGVERFDCLNVGTGVAHSVEEVVEVLKGILQREITIEIDEARARPVERQNLQANAEKVHQVTGWSPRYSLEEGLRALCAAEGLLST